MKKEESTTLSLKENYITVSKVKSMIQKEVNKFPSSSEFDSGPYKLKIVHII